MIDGFEEITCKLTKEEEELVAPICRALLKRVGEKNVVNSGQMIKGIMENLGVKIDSSRLRKIINHIRANNLIVNLVANSKGYYIENDPEKLKKYVQGLRKRAKAIIHVADSYKI